MFRPGADLLVEDRMQMDDRDIVTRKIPERRVELGEARFERWIRPSPV